MTWHANGDRLWDTLMEMAKVGPGDHGGSRRLALSDEDVAERNLFRQWASETGCTFRLEPILSVSLSCSRFRIDGSLRPLSQLLTATSSA